MSNVLGSFWNPYSYFDYEEECRNHTWNGGWVFIGSNHDKIYITTNGSVEQKEGTDELGSEENPFSLTAYNEMFGNHTWIGGYVQEEDDCVYYPPQEDESGCGCGCGEGCGCGCGCEGGIASGSELYQICVDDPMFALSTIVRITWGSGTFLHGNAPSLDVEYVSGTNFSFVYSWENAYRVHIYSESTAPHHFFYNIPHQYYR